MEKPQKHESRPYYDLICVLNYVDKKVKRFKNKMWDMLCDLGYINIQSHPFGLKDFIQM